MLRSNNAAVGQIDRRPPTGQRSAQSPAPLSVLFIDDRLHCYGPDLCARLRYPALAAAAAVTPVGSVALLELGSTGLFDAAQVSADHPLRAIGAEAEASIWIGLPGLLALYQRSPHPLAEQFNTWSASQRGFASLSAVPPSLFYEGLDLLERAVGPTAQVLAVLERSSPLNPRARDGRVIDPPDLFELGDIVGSCLADEVFDLEQRAASAGA